jgi:hypothetical protein
VVMRRGRRKTVCARGANAAWSSGPSASPLGGMSSLLLTDGASRLELDLVWWDGDAYVSVAVDSGGFSGRNDLHVVAAAFRLFCSQLLALQRTLKGEARLTAVVPGELDIHIEPAGSTGHLAIVGRTGYHMQIAHTTYWHEVRFGFQIEPAQLDAAARIPWVRQYAA